MKFIKNHLKNENKDEVVQWKRIIIGLAIIFIYNMVVSFAYNANNRYFLFGVDAIAFLILLCWMIDSLKKFHKISIGYCLKIIFLCVALLFYIQRWML